MGRIIVNSLREDNPGFDDSLSEILSDDSVSKFHQSIPEYQPTPLIKLPRLAQSLGLGQLWVKDESHRFDLKAFKVLGASFYIYCFLKKKWDEASAKPFDLAHFWAGQIDQSWVNRFTFCTATDGNHGRAVAWVARKFNQRAVIYMPAKTVPARIKNIENEGARVVLVDGEYDDAVILSVSDAEENGWIVISDTAWLGYEKVPSYIMAGYRTLFGEIDDVLDNEAKEPQGAGFDVLFLQAGVGSFAASGAWHYADKYGDKRPVIVVVEPTEAACITAMIQPQEAKHKVNIGNFDTIMAGLNCGTVSRTAGPILKSAVDACITIPDDSARSAMRRYYRPQGGDPQIISGESGAAGLGGLIAYLEKMNNTDLPDHLRFDKKTRVLLINTEGDTDPVGFKQVVGHIS